MPPSDDPHWLRWHEAYENPDSPLSLRLRLVQSMIRDFLDRVPPSHRRADPDGEPVRRAGP